MKGETKKHPRRKKAVLIVLSSAIAAFFLVVMPISTLAIYNDNFGNRFETADWEAYSVSDFDGLECSECTFPSNNGQLLAGYCYSKEDSEKRALL